MKFSWQEKILDGQLKPTSLEELKGVFNYCRENKLPIYTRKDLSSSLGGGAFLSLEIEKINEILEIDTNNLVAIVQPGVKLGDLRQALREEKLRFIPATPDKDQVTIGELYNSGLANLLGFKYNSARHHVMGLEVLLANGQVLKTGGKTVKNVTGYDLTKLFLSSRETLGLNIKYTLKLYPLAEEAKYLVIKGQDESLLNLAQAIYQAMLIPGCFSFANSKMTKGLWGEEGGALWLSCEGFTMRVTEEILAIEKMTEQFGCQLKHSDSNGFYKSLESFTVLEREQPGYNYVINKCKLPLMDWKSLTGEDLGIWGLIGQGKINLMIKNHEQFARVKEEILKLGGFVSLAKPSQLTLSLKKSLDTDGLLNPEQSREVLP